MKVLFLDVDGVLNNASTTERCNFYTGVDQKLAARLTQWLPFHKDVKIVLSSTWRNHPEMWYALQECGIHWIDVTRDIVLTRRGLEITDWLATHNNPKYAILDDQDYDFALTHADVFVKTDPEVGLQETDLIKLNNIFV